MSTKSKPCPNAQQATSGYAKLLQDVKLLKDRVSVLESNMIALLNNPPKSVDTDQQSFLKELFSNVKSI